MSALLWAKEAMAFVLRTLPDLLTKHGEGGVAEALEETAAKYREHRTAQLESRATEIQEQRDEVDTKLKAREAAERKKATS